MNSVKSHCCGADTLFDKKKATKEYRKYIKNGPTRVTKRIIKLLGDKMPLDKISNQSMIDVGGGIGALQWWFLEQGGNQTIDIDASSGYLEVAKKHADQKGWSEQTKFLMGDCTDIYPNVAIADIITLDKVVCCYPNYKEILTATCQKSKQLVVLSYPMDGLAANVLRLAGVLLLKIINNDYRPYIHSVKDIRNVMEENGFQKIAKDFAFPWHVEVYEKL